MTARPLSASDRRAIATWRYAGREGVYDPGDDVHPDLGFEALVDDDGDLVGYVCVGPEARVPGASAEPGVVDVGVGVRPDLVGGGWGAAVTAAALAVGRRHAPDADTARAFVLDWNARSRATLRRAGFVEAGSLVTGDGRTFVMAIRSLR